MLTEVLTEVIFSKLQYTRVQNVMKNRKRKLTHKKTPQRKSPRRIRPGLLKKNSVKRLQNKMKSIAYESPLKFLRQRRSKRQLIRDELSPAQPIKRQRLSHRRESVIIINDENDLDSFQTKTRSAKAPKSKIKNFSSRINDFDKTEVNDSVIILEDDQNQGSSNDLNQTEDVMVVWSSVTGSPSEKNENSNPAGIIHCAFDVNPTTANLRMLKGDYPSKWLGNYLKSQEQKSPQKKVRNTANNKKNRVPERKKKREQVEETEKHQGKKAPEKISHGKLREIIIDGANVARAHAKGKFFSDEGLKIVIDYFKERGHKVMAFVPQHVRNRHRQILENLNAQGVITFTPSRKAGKKIITPYDDRYILKYATKCEGIVVSNDQFKDLYEEKPEWRETIEKRVLPPTFVGDHLMFPEDPLGRHGPTLEKFLRHET